ncbi:hypothetical protein GCM10027048_01020 [Hymenobacter coalescens]
MNILTTGLLSTLLATTALAQAPVQSIPLAKEEALIGTVTLPNHHTLLLLGTDNNPQMRVLSLTPTGQTAWTSKVAHPAEYVSSQLYQRFFSNSDGNSLLLGALFADDNAALGMKKNQLMVQRVDEQGQVTRANFSLNLSDDKKMEHTSFGSFADQGALYLVTKETNHRLETVAFLLERYDPQTKKAQQLPLALPKAPEVKAKPAELFTDWVYAGFRRGKVYFYRPIKGQSREDVPEKVPTEYEVRVFDVTGQAAGGFTTALHQQFQPSTYVYSSGSLPHYGQGHVPYAMNQYSSQGNVTIDPFDQTSGSTGALYLDPNSEDCIFLGEYNNVIFGRLAGGQPLLGGFVARYSSSGQLLKLVQEPYGPELKSEKLLMSAAGRRTATYLFDPYSGHLLWEGNCDLTARGQEGPSAHLRFEYDEQWKVLRQSAWTLTPKSTPAAQRARVYYSGPDTQLPGRLISTLISYSGLLQPNFYLPTLALTQAPVYTKLEQLAGQEKNPEAKYVLSPSGSGTATVIKYGTGGPLTVYAL